MTLRRRVRRLLAPVPGAIPLARVVVETVSIAFRYRVTGLSAEAAFFLLLSLPPLLLGIVAGVGFFGERFSSDALDAVTATIEEWAGRFLTDAVVAEIIVPTVEDTLRGGRADLLSLGFVLSLWAGSRALHVFMDTIAIMYGQTGIRGIVGSRVLSLSLYLGTILVGGVVFPLVVIGPGLLSDWLPDQLQFLGTVYWPVVSVLGLVGLTALYHFATPKRSPFHRDFPGALVAVAIWLVASYLLRAWAGVAAGGSTVFGPLTAPIIALIWFYLLAMAVLVGAATNAAIRRLWPPPEYRGPVVRASDWWDQRRAPDDPRHTLTPVERESSEAPRRRARPDLESGDRVG